MRSGSFIDKLSGLSEYLYSNADKDYKDWKLIDTYSDNTGIFIELFDTGSEKVMALRGTEDAKDLKNDFDMWKKLIPQQAEPAIAYYLEQKQKYTDVVVTGYSLGGSLAQVIGNLTGAETYTFEAYGTDGLYSKKHTENIINFGNAFDPIFVSGFHRQIGKIYLMPVNGKEKDFYWHMPLNYGKPSQAKEFIGKLNTNLVKDFLKPGMVDAGKYLKTKAPKYTEKVKKMLQKD